VEVWDQRRAVFSLSDEYVELCMRTWISMAYLNSIWRQTKSGEATYSLVKVVSKWLDQGYGSPGIEDSETVNITLYKAGLEWERDFPRGARETLTKALQSQPNHEKITAALQKIKEMQLPEWRNDVAKQFPQMAIKAQIGPSANDGRLD
jgi:hypothetical protein